jgi:hypothetical protein
LGSVTDKLIRCSPFTDVVFQGIHKLFISLDPINVSDMSVASGEDNSSSRAIIYGRRVGINNVTGNRLTTAMNVEGWVGRLVHVLEKGTHRNASILGSLLERALDSLGRHPSKEGAEKLIIRLLRVDGRTRRRRLTSVGVLRILGRWCQLVKIRGWRGILVRRWFSIR